MSGHEIDEIKRYIDVKLDEKLQPIQEKLDPMYEVFTAGKLTGTIVKWVLGIISVILGIALAVRELLRK